VSIKSDWKKVNWVERLTIILLILMLPLIIIIAVDNWRRHYQEYNPIISIKNGGR
jgi:hypothetical protein